MVARLVAEGTTTVVGDINLADAQAVAAQHGEMAHAIAFDAGDEGSVRALIDAEIAQGNARLAQVSHVRRFHLLTKELDHDDGEVTATMKVRRSSIYKTYAAEIDALYH